MVLQGEMRLKTKIEIDNKEHILEIYNIKDGKITGLKLDEEIFLKQVPTLKPVASIFRPGYPKIPTTTITPNPLKNYKTIDNKKKCAKCKTWYPITEFHKNKNTKDGLQSYCKNCKSYSKKEYRLRKLKKTKNILVFETWINQLNLKQFTTQQFIKQHPYIKREAFDKIILDQIKKKHISQMGKDQFRVNING